MLEKFFYPGFVYTFVLTIIVVFIIFKVMD